jgi:hypothetical protein
MNPPLLCAFSRFDGVFVSLFSITSIFPPCELRLSDRHPTKVGFHSLFTDSSQPFAASSQRILCPFITHHDHPHHSTHYPSTHPLNPNQNPHHISSHPHHPRHLRQCRLLTSLQCNTISLAPCKLHFALCRPPHERPKFDHIRPNRSN